jgi:hypothetical protein
VIDLRPVLPPSLVERLRAAKPLAKNIKMHFDQSS